MRISEVYEYDFDEILASIKAMKYRLHAECYVNGMYNYIATATAMANAFGDKSSYPEKPMYTLEEDIKREKMAKLDDLGKDMYMRKQLLQWK